MQGPPLRDEGRTGGNAVIPIRARGLLAAIALASAGLLLLGCAEFRATTEAVLNPEVLAGEWADACRPVAANLVERHGDYVLADEALSEGEAWLRIERGDELLASIDAGDVAAAAAAWDPLRTELVAYLYGDPLYTSGPHGANVLAIELHNVEVLDRFIRDGPRP